MHAGQVLTVSAAPGTPVIVPLVDAQREQNAMLNGEQNVRLHSVIAHDTDTGYAQIQREWANPQLFTLLLAGLKPA